MLKSATDKVDLATIVKDANRQRNEDVVSAAVASCPKTCGYCCLTPAYNCKNKDCEFLLNTSLSQNEFGSYTVPTHLFH